MRFEVEVDDGANLASLHKARLAEQDPAPDMPSYIQRLTDRAVAQALAPIAPVTLPEALNKIAELEAELAASASAVPVAPAQPG